MGEEEFPGVVPFGPLSTKPPGSSGVFGRAKPAKSLEMSSSDVMFTGDSGGEGDSNDDVKDAPVVCQEVSIHDVFRVQYALEGSWEVKDTISCFTLRFTLSLLLRRPSSAKITRTTARDSSFIRALAFRIPELDMATCSVGV